MDVLVFYPIKRNLSVSLLVLAVCLLISSCASTPTEPPAWAISPPADTVDTYYGVGSGLSLEYAKRSAKNDIAEKIQTSVSSSINSSQTLSMGKASRSFKEEVKTQSAKINLRNSKLVASGKAGVQYYAQVSVPRANVIDDIRQRKDAAAKTLRDLLQQSSNNSRLENFIAFNAEKETASLLKALALMEKGVDISVNVKDDIQLANAFEAKAKKIKQSMRVYIQSARTLKVINASLKNSFSSQGVKLTTRKSKADLIITLTSSEDRQDVYDTKMALLKIEIVLRNKNGDTVYQEAQQASGASIFSFSKASELARIEAALKIKASKLFVYIKMNP